MALLSREQIEVLITAKNETDRALGRVSANLNSVARDAAKVTAAFVAIGTGVAAISNNLAETAITAELLGLTTDQLRDLTAQARAFAGVSDTQLSTSIQRMVRRLGDARDGNDQLARSFKQLGIDVQNLSPDLTAAQLFEQVAEGVRNLGSASEQLAVTQKILDVEGVRLVQLFRTSPAELDKFTKSVNAWGSSGKDAEDRAREFRATLVGLEEAFKRGGEALVLDFLAPWETAPERIAIIGLGLKREFIQIRKEIFEALAPSGGGALDALSNGAGGFLGKFFVDNILGNPEDLRAAAAESQAEILAIGVQMGTLRQAIVEQNIKAADADLERLIGSSALFAGGRVGPIVAALVGSPEANQSLFSETERLAKLHFDRLIEQEQRALDTETRTQTRQTEVEKRERDARLRQSQSFFSSSIGMAAQNSRGLFNIWKASAISNAVVSTYQAASNALADVRPFPLNIAAAAAVTAAGLARVASIKSASFGGGGGGSGGGFVGGFSGAGGNDQLPPPIVALPAASNQQQQRVELVITGGDAFGRMVVDSLSREVNEHDAVIIQPGSRQAGELAG